MAHLGFRGVQCFRMLASGRLGFGAGMLGALWISP